MNPREDPVPVLLAPFAFVVLWSTGYVVARFSVPDAGPLWFLLARFGLTSVLLAAIAVAVRAAPRLRPMDVLHACVAGLGVHGIGMGGVWVALEAGVETGVAALVMAMQPVLTAIVAAIWLGERVSAVQRLGLVLGLAGVALVIENKLAAGVGTVKGVAVVCGAVVGITFGALYQKRYCAHVSLLRANAVQFAAAAAWMLALAVLLDDRAVRWTTPVVLSLGWSVLVLSIGATALLYWMIRRDAASRIAGVFYLVPPLTALMGWWLFDERLSGSALAGMVLAVGGVALVLRRGQPAGRVTGS